MMKTRILKPYINKNKNSVTNPSMTEKELQQLIEYVNAMVKTPEYIVWKKREMIIECDYLRREIDKLSAEIAPAIADSRKRLKIKIAKLQKQLNKVK